MIRFETRPRPTALVSAAAPLGAVAAALLLATIPLAAAGAPIARAFALMAAGAAGSTFALTETLTRATPLILTGLAAAIAFRARLYNVGGEGQLYAGALAAVAVGSGAVDAPPALLVPLVLLAAALAGAALMLGPTLLKVRLGVDEVVTTLLLNFVVLLFVQMMLEGPFKDPMGGGWPQSEPILDAGMLPPLVERMRLHAGFLLGIAACIVLHVLVARTVAGLKIRAVGDNLTAARYAGMSVTGVMVGVGLLSGALAGLAGASEVAGLKGYLTADLSRGFGYAGIVVAMIAGLQPLWVLPAAIFVAGVFVGADTMSRTLNVSNYIADLIVAFSLLSVLVSSLFVRFRIRWS
ncbi:MAG TPA: ABC transporter permease [Microvirga sp.]|jgi:simple sugar transport system permease protein|nr:ABC transporter permease [Microvirga sp.]